MAIKYGDFTFTADFETTSFSQFQIDGCTRVWLWDVCQIKSLKHIHGNDLDSFFSFLDKNKKTKTLLFHNLKFDGKFILDYLFKNKYTYTKNSKLRENEFKCLISDKNIFFSIELRLSKCKVIIYDSLLKIPLSVSKIPKAFGFEDVITKGDIDYNLYRAIGYEPTDKEINYVERDTEIVARALQVTFNKGLMSMTQSSDSLNAFKSECKYFDKIFPKIPYEIDKILRESYRGGWTYINDIWCDKDTGIGTSFDVNSLYPSVMVDNLLPYGEPVFFAGRYEDDPMYPLYICQITINCDLKPNHLPTLQIKSKNCFKFQVPDMFLFTTHDELMKLTVTSIDLILLYRHYDIKEINFLCGYKFKGSYDLFRHYILELNKIKTTTTDKGERQLAKLKMNSLYGKTGMNPEKGSKVPSWDDEEQKVLYDDVDMEIGDGVYLPAACFITSYARLKTISAAQAVYPRFVYADTDSIHLIGTDEPNIPIDDKKLGYWKNEGTFVNARFLKSKTYIKKKLKQVNSDVYIYSKVKHKIIIKYPKVLYLHYYDVKCAGLTKEMAQNYKLVNMDNFHIGLTVIGGRKVLKTVPGGTVIAVENFNIL